MPAKPWILLRDEVVIILNKPPDDANFSENLRELLAQSQEFSHRELELSVIASNESYFYKMFKSKFGITLHAPK